MLICFSDKKDRLADTSSLRIHQHCFEKIRLLIIHILIDSTACVLLCLFNTFKQKTDGTLPENHQAYT